MTQATPHLENSWHWQGRESQKNCQGMVADAPGGVSVAVPFRVSEGNSGSWQLVHVCEEVSSVGEKPEIPSQVDSWERRRRKAVQVAAALDRIGEHRRAGKMRECGRVQGEIRRKCGHGQSNLSRVTFNGQHPFHPYHCDDRFCPVCAARRSTKVADRLERGVAAFRAVEGGYGYFLTLTFRDTDRLQPYALYTAARKTLFRHKWWKRYGLFGGIAAFETKIGKGSGLWHSHYHAIFFTRHPIPLIETGEHTGEFQLAVNQEIAELWQTITGGESFVVKGQEFNGQTRELVKYLTKDAEKMPDDRFSELVQWSRRKRFLTTFGKAYNHPAIRAAVEEQEQDTELCACPECGCREFEVMLYSWSDKHDRYLLDSVTELSLDDLEAGKPPGELIDANTT